MPPTAGVTTAKKVCKNEEEQKTRKRRHRAPEPCSGDSLNLRAASAQNYTSTRFAERRNAKQSVSDRKCKRTTPRQRSGLSRFLSSSSAPPLSLSRTRFAIKSGFQRVRWTSMRELSTSRKESGTTLFTPAEQRNGVVMGLEKPRMRLTEHTVFLRALKRAGARTRKLRNKGKRTCVFHNG